MIRMRTLLLAILLCAVVLVSACAPTAPQPTQPPAVTLDVWAAASLNAPFTELAQTFEAAHPGVKVTLNFGGSQQLAQQINEGAPVDVFASANRKQMDVVVEGGRIAADSPVNFVTNRLVVVLPADNPAGLNSLKDLAMPGLKLVLAAAEVPVGAYSLEFLDTAAQDAAFPPGFKEAVLANVVSYEQNVKSVLQKVALGEADAGIVYSSDVSGADAARVSQVDIPDALNVIASYPIAPLADSAHPELAKQFIAWVLSSEGQAVLARYGFGAP